MIDLVLYTPLAIVCKVYSTDNQKCKIENVAVLLNCILDPLLKVNPSSTNFPLVYPLKTSENLRFSDVSRRYRSEKMVRSLERGMEVELGQ